MRSFSLTAALLLSVFTVISCQGEESETPALRVNQSIVDTIVDLPRNEVSECLAASEYIHFHQNELGENRFAEDPFGQDVEIASVIRDHWMAAYLQAFSVGSVSSKEVLKMSDFRKDQSGLTRAEQMNVRDSRIQTCMAYTADALRQNGVEIEYGL